MKDDEMVAHYARPDDRSPGVMRFGELAGRGGSAATTMHPTKLGFRELTHAEDDVAHRSSLRREGPASAGSDPFPQQARDGHHGDRPSGAEHDVLPLDVDADRGC